jgi:hypothetical protein
MPSNAIQTEHQECLERCDSELGGCLNQTFDSPFDACNQRFKECERSCDGILGEGHEP